MKDLATAITALDAAADGNHWHISKGKQQLCEPLFAAAIYATKEPNDEPLAIAEGNSLAEVVHDVALQMGDPNALRREHGSEYL